VSAEWQILPWHTPQWRQLAQALKQQRLAHAWLFSGPTGCGTREFAQVFAAALWCRAPAADVSPCGVCTDCRQVRAMTHPNLHRVQVEEGKRDIPIEAARELCQRLAMTSHDGRAQLALIDPADALNRNSVNALLKTVEEPPAHSHLLLLAQRPLALPATLRSRCQQLRFPPPSVEQATSWLRAHAPAGAAVETALSAAHGAPLDALALLNDGGLDRQLAWRKAMLDLAAGRDDPVRAAQAIGEEQAPAFLRWFFATLANLLRLRTVGGEDADLERLARALPVSAAAALADELIGDLRRLESNARPLWLLESLLIRWQDLLARR